MPRYIVITNAGVGFEVGKEFEAESLHPAIAQHCRILGKGRDIPEPEQEDDADKTGTDEGKDETAKPNKPAKPTKPVKDPDDDNT